MSAGVLAALLSTLCFRDAGPCAATLEKLINKSLSLIVPVRPTSFPSMSFEGQQTAKQAEGFIGQQEETCR